MIFNKFIPIDKLKPYIKYFAVSEDTVERSYKVFPSTGLVIGFQYSGRLNVVKHDSETTLATSGITGISDSFKVFKNSAATGTVLVYFTEAGLTHFTSRPACEIFNQSVPLDDLFDKSKVSETEERLGLVKTDRQRIHIVERFLLSQLKDVDNDKLILEAIKLIYQSKGAIKIKELNEKLFISQRPLEERFKKIVGTTPKKFTSIVRFNTVLNQLEHIRSLTEICYENNFFDQAHFIKDFRQYTGDTPEKFRRFL